MLLWMLIVAAELTGTHCFDANGWLFVTLVCWLWHYIMSD